MKKNYIKPMVKIKSIDTEEMLAASLELKSSSFEDDNTLILNSKGNGINIWNDEEDEDSHGGIDWDD